MNGIIRRSVIAGALATMLCSSALVAAQGQPIIGCVMPGTGLLRIPSGEEGCKPHESPLGFNDLPMLVALQTQVQLLQAEIVQLKQRLELVEACTDSLPACNPE